MENLPKPTFYETMGSETTCEHLDPEELERRYLNKYPWTKRQCEVCRSFYSYKFRQRKRTGKTCSKECSRKRTNNLYKYSPEFKEYLKEYKKEKRNENNND
jgi:hypothetical protein